MNSKEAAWNRFLHFLAVSYASSGEDPRGVGVHVVEDWRLCHHGMTARDMKHILMRWHYEELEKYSSRDLLFGYRRISYLDIED